jgi:hypothetical protein
MYVSQLTQKVSLPDDELITEDVNMGNVKAQIPMGYNVHPITVTFNDDDANTVYLFHQKWFNAMKVSNKGAKEAAQKEYVEAGLTGDKLADAMGLVDLTVPSLSFHELTKISMRMHYISLADFNLSDLLLGGLTREVNGLTDRLPGQLANAASLANPLNLLSRLGIGTEIPTGMTVYPRVYPVKIVRTEADKAGNGFATVTVTYNRVVNMKWDNAGALAFHWGPMQGIIDEAKAKAQMDSLRISAQYYRARRNSI